MTPKTVTTDMTTLSDEDIAREILSNTRAINTGRRDPHFGRQTREAGHRRLAKERAAIAARVEAGAAAIAFDLGKASGVTNTDTLTRFASLHHLSEDDAAWAMLDAQIDAPTRRDQGPIWAQATDAERDAEKAERVRVFAAAQFRLAELTDEAERRRLVAEDEIEVERMDRYRASRGVS